MCSLLVLIVVEVVLVPDSYSCYNCQIFLFTGREVVSTATTTKVQTNTKCFL